MKKILDKKLGPVLKEHGFLYDKKIHHLGWRYQRNSIDALQYFTITQSPMDSKQIRFELSTSKSPYDVIYSGRLRREVGEGIQDYWRFDSEEDLGSVLEEMYRLFKEKGLEYLNILVKPEIVPSLEYEKILMENYKSLTKQFIEEFQAEFELADLKNIEIKFNQKKSLCESKNDWDLILRASAYFGERLVHDLGGEWHWDELRSRAQVTKLGGKPSVSLSPLSVVSKFWSIPERIDYQLSHVYEQFKLFATI